MNAQIIYNEETKMPDYVVLPWKEYSNMADRLYDFEHGDIPKEVKNPIKAMRTLAELTQTELAERMGVSQSYIGQIECPRRKPTAKLIERVKVAIESQ